MSKTVQKLKCKNNKLQAHGDVLIDIHIGVSLLILSHDMKTRSIHSFTKRDNHINKGISNQSCPLEQSNVQFLQSMANYILKNLGLNYETLYTSWTSTLYLQFYNYSAILFLSLFYHNLSPELFFCIKATSFFRLFLDLSTSGPCGYSLLSLTRLSRPMLTSEHLFNNPVFSLRHGSAVNYTWCSCPIPISKALARYLTMYSPAFSTCAGPEGLACTSAHSPLCHTSLGVVNLFSFCSLSSSFLLLCCVFPQGHPAVWPCHMVFFTTKTKHGLPLSGCTRFTLLCMGCFPCIPARLH